MSSIQTDGFLAQVDELEKTRAEHVAAVQQIDDTLAALRKRLASSPGARAGKNARSGRRRKSAVDVTDLRPADRRATAFVDARGGERVPETVTD